MSKQKPSQPKGTRDFAPDVLLKRNYIIDTIKEEFRKFGFLPLETPAIENLSVLTGKYGDEGDQLIFKILNSGDYLNGVSTEDFEKGSKHLLPKISEKALRYDLTIPFARFVATHKQELTLPFKRYQIQPVWRADRPQKGRYREFYQCDADIAGTKSLLCEAEFFKIIQTVFAKLGIEDYTIKYNHRKLLRALSAYIGQAGRETDLCVAIDKLDKIGREKVVEELLEKGFSPEKLSGLFDKFEAGRNGVDAFFNSLKQNNEVTEASADLENSFNDLHEIESYFPALGVDEKFLQFDPTLARGLGYYTGCIFEVKINGVSIGSVSGGGRYEDLTGVFGVPDTPGVGFSFGIDRLYDCLQELNLFPSNSKSETEYLFINFGGESFSQVLAIATQLRAMGKIVEVYPEAVKLKKQMSYADAKGVEKAIIIGEDELASKSLSIKNLISGEQKTLAVAEFFAGLG